MQVNLAPFQPHNYASTSLKDYLFAILKDYLFACKQIFGDWEKQAVRSGYEGWYYSLPFCVLRYVEEGRSCFPLTEVNWAAVQKDLETQKLAC